MPAPFDLLLVVDPRIAGVLDALAWLGAEANGERIAVQLRAKDASDVELLHLAREVAAVQPPMSRLLINGRLALARAIAADGAHLPESAASVREARALLLPGTWVGASCHDEAGVRRRASEGADYVSLGPLGAVPGKPSITEEVFASIARATSVPIVALGGITSAADADHALALGASAIALQRGLLSPAWIPDWLARRHAS